MNGDMNALEAGLVPIGALAGGVMGQAIGLRPTLLLSAGGELMIIIWLLFTPIRSMVELPDRD